MYIIKFTPAAYKRFKQLDKRYQKAAKRAIDRLSQNPYLGEPLTGKLKLYWKLRFSRYRIIYRVEKQAVMIIIFDIRHRRDVYRFS